MAKKLHHFEDDD